MKFAPASAGAGRLQLAALAGQGSSPVRCNRARQRFPAGPASPLKELMDSKTAWLKPPYKAGGIDHLGIQQMPIRIFSTLLPGLTVVTDRISNYSFYPWVAWAY